MSVYNGVMYSSPPPPGVTPDPSQPFDADTIIAITAVFLPLAALLTSIRLYTRGYLVGHLSIDDYLMMGATLLSIVMSAFCMNLLNFGLGKDMWNVPMTPDLYPNFNFNNLMAAIFFCAATGLAKGSILLFYLRIFPAKSVHIATWFVFVFTEGYSLACVFVNIFSCDPITASWVLADVPAAKCINRPVFYFAQAGLGILTDIATVALPLPLLKSLHLPRKQKIIVGLDLSMGAFVCVISIVRLKSLQVLLNDPNLTRNTVLALTWCVIELNCSIIGGCVPTVKPFVQRLCPGLLDSTRRGTSGKYFSGKSNRNGNSGVGTSGTGRSVRGGSQSQGNSNWGAQLSGKTPGTRINIHSSPGTHHTGESEEYIMIDRQAITKTVEYGFFPDDEQNHQSGSRNQASP